jgi:nucleoside-diphosphate-sugar epimerase
VLRACEAPNIAGEVINVATGSRISINALFRAVQDLLAARVEPTYAPARAGDVRDSQADISKAQRLLGYQPVVGFDEGLKKTVDWYRTSQLTVA